MKVKSESEVTQSCPTLHDPMDCSPPGSSVHEISQARVLEWGATAFSGSNLAHHNLKKKKNEATEGKKGGEKLCSNKYALEKKFLR